jgi:GNAT superfamily N-acetyltransferase
MYLEDILVTEEMRGQKIGSQLFDTLIKEAKEKKFTGMNWQVLEWNEPAINFYKKYNASFDPEWHNGSIVF